MIQNDNQLHLTVPFYDFANLLDDKIAKATKLNSQKVSNELEYQDLKREIENWETESKAILSSSFNIPNNEFFTDFKLAGRNRFNIANNKSLEQLVRDVKEDLPSKQISLYATNKTVMISDIIRNPNQILMTQRAAFTTNEKLDLLLDKLYDLADDYYHSVNGILNGNGIKLRQSDEIRGLAKVLANNGYIDELAGAGADMNAKITVEGSMHVEEKRSHTKESYKDVNRSQEELNSKIDEILAELKKQGYGQEVLFNELQEVRDLYSVLPKKNWIEMLKGKMIDLAWDKATDTEVLKFIYHALTARSLMLP